MSGKFSPHKSDTQVNIISSSIIENIPNNSSSSQQNNNNVLRKERPVISQLEKEIKKIKMSSNFNSQQNQNQANLTKDSIVETDAVNFKTNMLNSNKNTNSQILIKPETKEILEVRTYIKNKQDRSSLVQNSEYNRKSIFSAITNKTKSQNNLLQSGKYIPIYSKEAVRRNVSKYLLNYRYKVMKAKSNKDKIIRSPWDDLNAQKFKLISYTPERKVHIVDSKHYPKKKVILSLPYKKRLLQNNNNNVNKPKVYTFERYDYALSKNKKQLEKRRLTVKENSKTLDKIVPLSGEETATTITANSRKETRQAGNISEALYKRKSFFLGNKKSSNAVSREETYNACHTLTLSIPQVETQSIVTKSKGEIVNARLSSSNRKIISDASTAAKSKEDPAKRKLRSYSSSRKQKLPFFEVETRSTSVKSNGRLTSKQKMSLFENHKGNSSKRILRSSINRNTTDASKKQNLTLPEIQPKSANCVKSKEQKRFSSSNRNTKTNASYKLNVSVTAKKRFLLSIQETSTAKNSLKSPLPQAEEFNENNSNKRLRFNSSRQNTISSSKKEPSTKRLRVSSPIRNKTADASTKLKSPFPATSAKLKETTNKNNLNKRLKLSSTNKDKTLDLSYKQKLSSSKLKKVTHEEAKKKNQTSKTSKQKIVIPDVLPIKKKGIHSTKQGSGRLLSPKVKGNIKKTINKKGNLNRTIQNSVVQKTSKNVISNTACNSPAAQVEKGKQLSTRIPTPKLGEAIRQEEQKKKTQIDNNSRPQTAKKEPATKFPKNKENQNIPAGENQNVIKNININSIWVISKTLDKKCSTNIDSVANSRNISLPNSSTSNSNQISTNNLNIASSVNDMTPLNLSMPKTPVKNINNEMKTTKIENIPKSPAKNTNEEIRKTEIKNDPKSPAKNTNNGIKKPQTENIPKAPIKNTNEEIKKPQIKNIPKALTKTTNEEIRKTEIENISKSPTKNTNEGIKKPQSENIPKAPIKNTNEEIKKTEIENTPKAPAKNTNEEIKKIQTENIPKALTKNTNEDIREIENIPKANNNNEEIKKPQTENVPKGPAKNTNEEIKKKQIENILKAPAKHTNKEIKKAQTDNIPEASAINIDEGIKGPQIENIPKALEQCTNEEIPEIQVDNILEDSEGQNTTTQDLVLDEDGTIDTPKLQNTVSVIQHSKASTVVESTELLQENQQSFEDNINSLCLSLNNISVTEEKEKLQNIMKQNVLFFDLNKSNVLYYRIRRKCNTSAKTIFHQNTIKENELDQPNMACIKSETLNEENIPSLEPGKTMKNTFGGKIEGSPKQRVARNEPWYQNSETERNVPMDIFDSE